MEQLLQPWLGLPKDLSQLCNIYKTYTLVLEQLGTNISQVFLGENKSYVLHDMRKDFLQVGVLSQVSSNGLTNHGVLSHKNDGMSYNYDKIDAKRKIYHA